MSGPDVRRLRATAHPVRLEMLSLLTGAELSAAEVARELGITQANASYHLRLLRTAGLLEEAGQEKVNGGTAKRYRALWDRQQPRDPAHADADAEAEIRAMFEVGASRLGQRRLGHPGPLHRRGALGGAGGVGAGPRAADRGLPADARVGPPAADRGHPPREPLGLRVPAEEDR